MQYGYTQKSTFVPRNLAKTLFDKMDTRGMYQQDPHELFMYVVHLLTDAVQHQRSSVFHVATQIRRDSVITETVDEMDVLYKGNIVEWEHLYSRTPNCPRHVQPSFEQPFEGLLYEDIVCVVCKKSRPQPVQPFTSLSLSFPVRRSSPTKVRVFYRF